MATICTDAFAGLARDEAAAGGLPDLPLVVIPHPLGGLTAAEVHSKAEEALTQVVQVLTGVPRKPAPTVAPDAGLPDGAAFCDDEACRYEPRPTGESLTVEDSLDGVEEINRRFSTAGWTDGLPIALPTDSRVRAALGFLALDADRIIGLIPPQRTPATAEKIVVNALMAGCRTEYLPVVLAAVQAMLDPRFDLGGVQATTGPHAPLVVVNGPLARELAINAGHGAFGPGWQGNATIGRAIRLILLNLGGAAPGSTDKSTQGHPSKYTYCIAENEAANPWTPLHVERGFAPETSTVTVVACHSPVNIHDTVSQTAAGILTTAADTMATIGGSKLYRTLGEAFLLLGPEHAAIIARDGWTKDDVRQFIFEHARRPVAHLKRGGMYGPETAWPRWLDHDDQALVPLVERPSDIGVLVVGGAGRHSSHLITWSASRSITTAIEVPSHQAKGEAGG
ncbi:MAG: hypothetical protein M5U01_37020 [Ardenticatenaceae bacterium]|nr:hypothetical protein [Ardenticatenaceae bacterium]